MFDKLKLYYFDLNKDIPILRCVFAVSFALLFGTSIGYPAAHATAIFALMFIGPGKKPMSVISLILYPILLYLLGWFGVFIGNYLIDYPLVVIPLLGLIIFWSFRQTKIPAPARLLFLILVVLIPFASISGNSLGNLVLFIMVGNMAIALFIVKFSFLLFPQTKLELEIPKKEAKEAAGAQLNMDKVALNGMLVILPLLIFIYVSNATSNLLLLVFTVVLAFDPFIYQSKKGLIMVLANVAGGIIGILATQVLILATDYSIYIFLTISISFYFVINMYAGKKISPIYGTSFNTFFVVMGTIATSTNSAASTVWERIFQIGLAVIYTVIAYKIVNMFNNPLKSAN